MDQWQYMSICFNANATLNEEEAGLNKLGAEGWELASTIVWGDREKTIHYLKRRVPEVSTYRT